MVLIEDYINISMFYYKIGLLTTLAFYLGVEVINFSS